MRSKGDRKSKTVEIMVDGLKSPASVPVPVVPTKDMSFEQISLMFSQMQQMMVQLQKQNEQLHMTLNLLLQKQFGRSSEQLQQNPDWQTLPLFAPEMLPQQAAPQQRRNCKPTGRKRTEEKHRKESPFGSLPHGESGQRRRGFGT